MSTFTLICIAGFGSLSHAFQEVLASKKACAYSTTWNSTVFNAPQNGTISGIKAVYASGSPMTCNMYCSSERTKWGCIAPCWSSGPGRKFMVEILKVTDATNRVGITRYPTDYTSGYLRQSTQSCIRGCTQWFYEMDGQDINDTNITWDGAIYEVTTSDQYMLQSGEGCCETATSDNEGYVCAQIYFLYGMHLDFISVLQISQILIVQNQQSLNQQFHQLLQQVYLQQILPLNQFGDTSQLCTIIIVHHDNRRQFQPHRRLNLSN